MAAPSRARKKHAKRSPNILATNRQDVQALRDWLLPDASIFAAIALHGNSKWLPANLVWMALCWAWSDKRCVTDGFIEALTACQPMLGVLPLSTYQGFMGALVTWTSCLLPLVCTVLQQRMQAIGGKFWRIDGWVPIALDGSRSTAPRTKSNEAALCAKNYGHGKTAKYRKFARR